MIFERFGVYYNVFYIAQLLKTRWSSFLFLTVCPVEW